MAGGRGENSDATTSSVSAITAPIVSPHPVPSATIPDFQQVTSSLKISPQTMSASSASPLMFVKQEPSSPSPTPMSNKAHVIDMPSSPSNMSTINPSVLTHQVAAAGNTSIHDIEPGEIIRPPGQVAPYGMVHLPSTVPRSLPASQPPHEATIVPPKPATDTNIAASSQTHCTTSSAGLQPIMIGEPRVAEPAPIDISKVQTFQNGAPAGFASIALRCQDGVTRWFPLQNAPPLVPQSLPQPIPQPMPQTLPTVPTVTSQQQVQPQPRSEQPRHHSWSSRHRHITYSAPVISTKTREGIIMKATQKALIDKIVKQTFDTPQDLSLKHNFGNCNNDNESMRHQAPPPSDVQVMQGHYNAIVEQSERSPSPEVIDLSLKLTKSVSEEDYPMSSSVPAMDLTTTLHDSRSSSIPSDSPSPFAIPMTMRQETNTECGSRKRKRGLDSIMARLWENKVQGKSESPTPSNVSDIDEMKAAYADMPTNDDKVIIVGEYQKCHICHEMLLTAAELYEHLQQHIAMDNLRCVVCDYQATSQEDLAVHRTEEHDPVPEMVSSPQPPDDDVYEDEPGTEYLCTHCGKGMTSADALEKHIADHEKEIYLQYACRHIGCGMKFASHDELWQHIDRDHFTAQVLEIQQAQNKMYMEELQLQKQQQNIVKQQKVIQQVIDQDQMCQQPQQQVDEDEEDAVVLKQVYVCPQLDCAMTFSSSSHLKQHYEEEHEPIANTDRAYEQFTSKLDIEYTNITVDQTPDTAGPTETKFHVCQTCKQLFSSGEKMWSHRIAEHDALQRLQCQWCSYGTDNRLDLESHCGTAHGQDLSDIPEYLCSWCGKTFTSRTGYRYHMFRHGDEGPPQYQCPTDDCTMTFRNRTAIKLHVSRAHPRPSASVTSSTVKQEEGIVDISDTQRDMNETLHACNFPGCDKVFREAKHLKVHRMLHTDEKPLKCEVCEYSCRQRNSMNWHMKSKHNKMKEVTPDGRTIYV